MLGVIVGSSNPIANFLTRLGDVIEGVGVAGAGCGRSLGSRMGSAVRRLLGSERTVPRDGQPAESGGHHELQRFPAPRRLPSDEPARRGRVGLRRQVAPGDCSPGAPTDPDLRSYRIRLFGLRVRWAKVP